MFRLLAFVAALSAALFTMPATAAFAADQTACGDAGCGSGGGGTSYTPGCSDVETDSSSGDVDSFSSSDDMDPDFSDVSMSYAVPDPGTWNVSYNWQTVDGDGNTIDSGTFSGDEFTVPNDGHGYRNNVTALLPRPPVGGALYINIYGLNDFMQPLSGEGDTLNYGCNIIF